MNEQEFEKAFSDADFVNMLLNLETGEEVKKALADKGINLTTEELDKFAEILVCALESGNGIKDEKLSKISGGNLKNFDKIKKEAIIFSSLIRHGKEPNLPKNSWILNFKRGE